MMDRLEQAWQTRQPRERILLLVAGLFLAVVGLWLGVVEPLHKAGTKAEKDLPELRRQAEEMRRLTEEAGRLKAEAVQPTAASAAALANAAAGHGFNLSVVQSGDGRYELRLDNVPMTGLGDWLAGVARSHRLFAYEARLIPAGDGRVSGEMVLEP